MNILLYNPDNEVTNNYMPHLWMFLLQALTPPGHKVFLVDGNAQPMNEEEIANFVRENEIKLAGIGAMTRMAARAYRMADAIRAAGRQSGHGRSARHGGSRRAHWPRHRAPARGCRRFG